MHGYNPNKINVRKLTYLALFTALVFLLQLLAFVMRGPVFSITLVLVPIVIAVAICGVSAGPWLGFVFGIAVLVTGDANIFLAFDPVATVFVVLLKGTLAGLAGALTYKALCRYNSHLAVTIAAVVTPVVNSGVFFLGAITLFSDLISGWIEGSQNLAAYVITGMIGVNFLIEVAINLVLVPVIYRVIGIVKKQ